MTPEITGLEILEFDYELEDVRSSDAGGVVYDPGTGMTRYAFGVRVHTDIGTTGEYVGGNPGRPAVAQMRGFAESLVGRNPFERERIWRDLRHGLRKYDGMGLGPVDIALWDFAGKHLDAPICDLLGRFRTRLPAYASTYHGDENGVRPR